MHIYSDKVLYLIGGPNGSGKTTLARELISDNPNISFLNADDIAREYNVSPLRAGAILFDKMDKIFSTHDSFVFETTLSGRYHNNIIARAKSDDYKIVFLYVFLSSVEQNIARVRQRVALGGHDVTESTIRRRYSKSIMNFERVAELSDQWELYYNGGSSYELLARGIHERVKIINNPMYSSFLECRAGILSEHLLELAKRAAERARMTALNAGVPIVSVER